MNTKPKGDDIGSAITFVMVAGLLMVIGTGGVILLLIAKAAESWQ